MAPCSRCEKSGLECRTLPESKRCGECVKSGYMKCDVSGLSPSEWDILTQEEARLEAEEEAAALAEQEAFSRRMEIRKRQKELRDRGSEMLRRGLRTLDELDAAEDKERREREQEEERQRVATETVGSSSAVVDLDFFDPSLPGPDDPFWAALDIAGGTPRVSQGNSSRS